MTGGLTGDQRWAHKEKRQNNLLPGFLTLLSFSGQTQDHTNNQLQTQGAPLASAPDSKSAVPAPRPYPDNNLSPDTMGAIARALLTATIVATVNATFQSVKTWDQLQLSILSQPSVNPIEIEVSQDLIWDSVLTVKNGENLIIRGSNDLDRFTLDAKKSRTFFKIENGGTLIISKLVLQNGYSYDDEGAIYNKGTFTSTDCLLFSGNKAGD